MTQTDALPDEYAVWTSMAGLDGLLVYFCFVVFAIGTVEMLTLLWKEMFPPQKKH